MEPGSGRKINAARIAWWKQENREALLAELWPQREISTSQIGVMMGCTKNMVISKAHRLDLGPRDPNWKPPEPKTRHHALLDIEPGACSYPIGHPTEPGFHFCGGTPVAGRPYCEQHAKLAYIRAKPSSSGWTAARREQHRAMMLKRHGSAG